MKYHVTHYHRFQGWRANCDKYSWLNFVCWQKPLTHISPRYVCTYELLLQFFHTMYGIISIQYTRGFAVYAVTSCCTVPVKEGVICSSEHSGCAHMQMVLCQFEPCSVCKQPAHRQGNRTRCSPFVQLRLTSTTTPRSHGSRRQAYMLI
jgi:hypothetical protein